SKLNLNAAMGVEGPTDYDVADTQAPPVAGEDGVLDSLLDEAMKARPEVQSLEDQIRATQLTMRSIEGQYGPSVSATAGLTQGGQRHRAGRRAGGAGAGCGAGGAGGRQALHGAGATASRIGTAIGARACGIGKSSSSSLRWWPSPRSASSSIAAARRRSRPP